MESTQHTPWTDGLRAFGGLSDAYMRSTNIIAETRIVSIGIMLSVYHPKGPAGFKSWEILPWDIVATAENLEKVVIELFVKHAEIVLDKAGLPMPLIHPYRVKAPKFSRASIDAAERNVCTALKAAS